MKNKLLKSAILLTILFGYPCLMGMEGGDAAKAARAEAAASAEKAKKAAEAPQSEYATKKRQGEQKILQGKVDELKGLMGQKRELSTQQTERVKELMKELSGSAKAMLTIDQRKAIESLRIQAKVGIGEAAEKAQRSGQDVIETQAKKKIAFSLEGFGTVKKREEKATAIVEETATARADAIKKSLLDNINQWRRENPKAFAAAGIGLALLALLGLGGLGVGTEEGLKSEDKEEIPGINNKIEPDGPVIPPNPYVPAAPDNEAFQNSLLVVANVYNKIEDQFKASVERGDYYKPKFRIVLGQVTLNQTQDVAIEYNFGEGGAGSIGSALTPIEVNIFPNEIDGFAVSVDNLLSKIDPQYQELATLLMQPNSAFLFLLKIMLLNKSVFKSTKITNNFDRVREMLTQSALLYSRLILTRANADPSTQSLLSAMPLSIQKYFSEMTTKMYPELLQAAQTTEKGYSVIVETFLNIRASSPDYKNQIMALNDTFLPLIQKDLSYSDKKFVVHAVLRQIGDLGAKLPAKTDAKNKELFDRVNILIPLVSNIIAAVDGAEFEALDIARLKKQFVNLNEIRTQKTKRIDLPKPRLGEPKSSTLQDISLMPALDIYLHQFQILQNTKFSGDYGFIESDLLLGKSETTDALLAALLRGVKMVTEAEASLVKSTNISIELRKSGSTFSINPANELDKLIKQPTELILQAQKAVAQAATTLREDPKNEENKKAYDAARAQFDSAVNAMKDSLQKFRYAYPPYLPLKFSDDSTKTTLEFLQAALKNIIKVGQPDALKSSAFSEICNSFTKTLGLSSSSYFNAAALAK